MCKYIEENHHKIKKTTVKNKMNLCMIGQHHMGTNSFLCYLSSKLKYKSLVLILFCQHFELNNNLGEYCIVLEFRNKNISQNLSAIL